MNKTTFAEFAKIQEEMHSVCDKILTAYVQAKGPAEFDCYHDYSPGKIPEAGVESMDVVHERAGVQPKALIEGSYYNGCETVRFSITVPTEWIDNFDEDKVRAAGAAAYAERIAAKQAIADERAAATKQAELKQLEILIAKHPDFAKNNFR